MLADDRPPRAEIPMHTDYQRAREAILYIAENAAHQPTLDQVAAHVGLSPSHFQRLFVRWAGVSPKRFLQHLTAARAKELLRESRPVIEAAFEAGLSGAGRLHDLLVTSDAVTPGEYGTRGEGVRIRYGAGETPFGRCLAATTSRGICALHFLGAEGERQALDSLMKEWSNAQLVRDDEAIRHLLGEVFSRALGIPRAPLHLRGTNFQLKVWQALLAIPAGSLISYGELAERIGESTAVRAVARAVGSNDIGYLIPCHRVLRSSGHLGGYRWGLDRKLVMIERELNAATPHCDHRD